MKKLYEKERDSLLELIEQNTLSQGKKEYHAKTIISGNQVEVQIYELWPTGCAGRGRGEKLTRQRQEKLNLRHRQERIVRLINANFTDHDTWLTLTYDDKYLPATEEEAARNIRNYINRVKYKFGNVKYIYATEYGEGRVHHHVILNVRARDELEDLWAPASERARKRKNPRYTVKRYGRTQARRMQSDDFGFTGMARYVTKESKKNKKSFVPSTNLTQPTERKTKTLRGRQLTNRFVKKLAEDKAAAKMEFLKLFPDCQFNDVDVRQTPYTRGYYIYARLKIINDSGG